VLFRSSRQATIATKDSKVTCDKIATKVVDKIRGSMGASAIEVFCNGTGKASLVSIDDSSPQMVMLRKIMVVKDPSNLGVGLDVQGETQAYQDLQIAAAWRVHNPGVVEKYIRIKCEYEKKADGNETRYGVPIPEMNEGMPGGRPLDKHLNEKYFFHGTSSPEAVEPILCGGLTRGGGLFGDGVYLADRPEKLDQYTNHAPEEGGHVMDKFLPKHKIAKLKGRFFYAFIVRAVMGHTFEGMCTCENCQAEARRYPFLILGERCVRCGRLSTKIAGVKRYIDANLTYDPLQPGRVKGIEPTMTKDKFGYMKYSSANTISYDSLYARASLQGCIKRYNEAVVPLMSDRVSIEYVIAYQRCKQPVTKDAPCDVII